MPPVIDSVYSRLGLKPQIVPPMIYCIVGLSEIIIFISSSSSSSQEDEDRSMFLQLILSCDDSAHSLPHSLISSLPRVNFPPILLPRLPVSLCYPDGTLVASSSPDMPSPSAHFALNYRAMMTTSHICFILQSHANPKS